MLQQLHKHYDATKPHLRLRSEDKQVVGLALDLWKAMALVGNTALESLNFPAPPPPQSMPFTMPLFWVPCLHNSCCVSTA